MEDFKLIGVSGRHAVTWLYGDIAVKVYRRGFEERAERECKLLCLLEPFSIAPKPFVCGRGFLVMERLEGLPWEEMPLKLKHLLAPEFLKQLYLLDLLGIEKRECHRPAKHFLLTSTGIKLIDFERAKVHKRPIKKNVLQFLGGLYKIFKDKKIIEAARKYVRNRSSFEELLAIISALRLPQEPVGKALR